MASNVTEGLFRRRPGRRWWSRMAAAVILSPVVLALFAFAYSWARPVDVQVGRHRFFAFGVGSLSLSDRAFFLNLPTHNEEYQDIYVGGLGLQYVLSWH